MIDTLKRKWWLLQVIYFRANLGWDINAEADELFGVRRG